MSGTSSVMPTKGALPILYSFRRCPYAMRARLALYYAGQTVELREVVLKDKPKQMLEASSKGTVPVLVDNNTVIDESLDIMHWALSRSDPHQWLCPNRGDLDEDALIQEHDQEFKPLLDRYKYFDRHPEKSQEEHLQSAMPFLHELETRIKRDGDGKFLIRSQMSVQDIAIFPFIRQFANSDIRRFNQLDLPCLQRWLQGCLNMPLFSNIMVKYDRWDEAVNNSVIFA